MAARGEGAKFRVSALLIALLGAGLAHVLVVNAEPSQPKKAQKPRAAASGSQPKEAAQRPAVSFALAVEGDTPIEVAFGPPTSAAVIVYMHGVCGDPYAFRPWAGAATKHATFISLRGDIKCKKRRGRYKWSYNYERLSRRIDAAIHGASKQRQNQVTEAVALDPHDLVLAGYSQGAHRVEAMAYRYPKRFHRVVMMAPALQPKLGMLAKAQRILLVGGGWDARKHITDSRDELRLAKKQVLYVELPKARHGDFGPESRQYLERGLDWLFRPTGGP